MQRSACAPQVQKMEWKIADTFLFFETCTVTGDVPYGDHFQVLKDRWPGAHVALQFACGVCNARRCTWRNMRRAVRARPLACVRAHACVLGACVHACA